MTAFIVCGPYPQTSARYAVILIGMSPVDHEYEVLLLHPTNMSHGCSFGFPVRVRVFSQLMPLLSSVGGRGEQLAPMENSCTMRS
jgi:hypothetical protein